MRLLIYSLHWHMVSNNMLKVKKGTLKVYLKFSKKRKKPCVSFCYESLIQPFTRKSYLEKVIPLTWASSFEALRL